MARIEHIRRRLENWALWRSRMNDGAHGYQTRNILAAWAEEAGGREGYESRVPVFDEDAEETDKAVQALKLGRSHLYVTLDYIYLRGLGVNETARQMRRAVSTVHAQLDQADHWIDAWLRVEREARDRVRAQAAAEVAALDRGFTS